MLDLAAIKSQASIVKVAEASGLSLTRDSDNEYKCQCVFHSDRSPSLSFTVDKNLFCCFGCGASGSVIDFVAKLEDLSFKDAAVRAAELAGLSASDINLEPKLVDTAVFVDEKGQPIFGEDRYEPGEDGKKKSFKQWHIDQSGEKVYSMPPRVRRVLYNLPAVLKSETVFLVESKKDVDTLEAWGFTATKKPSGARSEWYREYTEALIGRTVIQLPDQESGDKPGASFARKVEMALAGKAKNYLCVNVNKGKDITQFQELGGTKEDLLELIDGANQPANSPTKRTQEIIRKRGMPQAPESEKLVLGVVLRGYATFDDICGITADDLIQPNHARIYACIADLSEKGGSTDTMAVGQTLKNSGLDVLDYLVEISSEIPAVYNLDWHLEAIQESSRARAVVTAASKAADMILLGGKVDEAMELMSNSSQSLAVVKNEESRMQCSTEIVGNLDEFFKPKPPGVLSSIQGLNALTRGLKRKKLYVVAGRPGEGKSSLARMLGLWAARGATIENDGYFQEPYNTELISLEMPNDEVMCGVIGQLGQLDTSRIVDGLLTDDEKQLAASIIYRLHEVPFSVDDQNDWTILSIRNHLKQAKLKGKPVDCLIIDYLQIMNLPGKDRRDVEIGNITSGLKRLATEFDCIIILLSQLSREGVKLNRKPILSDLKDSGSIEADADVVIFVWQDWTKDNQDNPTRDCELIVPKHRGGPTGTALCSFLKSSTLFFDK